jgi:sugar O-acyltransferase (sialic acid O-acetyltransferase NeuD family)
MKREIYIIGAGSYGEAMFELATHCGFEVVGFYDDDIKKINQCVMDVKVKGTIQNLLSHDLKGNNYAVAIGNNSLRTKIMDHIRERGGITPSLIHNSAEISKYAEIGCGVYIQPKAVIWTKVKIEDDCIVSPLTLICHHSILKKGSLLSNLSTIGSNIIVEEQVFIGMGSTIMTGIKKIGKNSIIGAGSVVIRDVSPNTVVAGVPAKFIKFNK